MTRRYDLAALCVALTLVGGGIVANLTQALLPLVVR